MQLTQPGRVQQLVDRAGQGDQRREAFRRGEHDPVTRERPAQPTQRGHGHEQVADLQRTQHEHVHERRNTLCEAGLTIVLPGTRHP